MKDAVPQLRLEANRKIKIKNYKQINQSESMKKMYAKPTMDVVEYHMSQITCTSVKHVSAEGTGLEYGGGGNGPARGKSSIWDEE